MTAAAALAMLVFARSSDPRVVTMRAAPSPLNLILFSGLMTAIALLVLPATSFRTDGYAMAAASPARARRWLRWSFLTAKVALIWPLVFCGSFDMSPFLGATGLQADFLMIGYVLAFRWALIDQRRRCPVCLRLLSNPARIGSASQTFLELYGTELLCSHGHGFMHVPEIPASYSAQRWLDLDPSWSSLF